MWSYYGSKSKIVDLYPPPKYDKIIEPFAGTARYALKWFDRDVLLFDKYHVIVAIWNYLKQASKNDILSLPDMKAGDTVDDHNLSKEEKWLIGFSINEGSAAPKISVKDFNGWDTSKIRIANSLHKIRHWQIELGSFEQIENQQATWFIDPPYQYGGEWYAKGKKHIDFNNLADYCKTRMGQAIVCENTKADWLDFKPMKEMQGQVYKTTEAIWSNLPTNYDYVQQRLF